MEIEIKGHVSDDPRDCILAIEAVTRALCQRSGADPAEGIMMLLTSAAHLYAQHSKEPYPKSADGLAEALGAAILAAHGFFTLKAVQVQT